ncbi:MULTISPECIES: hypothetical protein [unclassified Lactobacillus]|jgi:hypothetical protein|uniref:hypothetical protein n=1 Tax=unclassified Lactobacillus TaxID=2620435 RepID=UPI000EFB42B7|nr:MULTISPECIES: hypothetical protein [unclassified Lactobacillus]RMC25742.1 hypothetical protein F5ESL0247_00895 [Lactobacillus sp. ESL0247]RMC29554.1 hypothetical protein F5ESL0246_00895 [Lactobacillus sp. ESL0246]RMC33543.1 hypothetical protein F5ESL0245_00895 [Lactobacillus sp. ESL0245]RMC51549.1 hypothetical protein F5ESL0228_00830 [Lactobacillus sp. ESL0228]
MEIGPLSEWVTACAEIAAVCVALFLPYFDKMRAKRKKTRNMKIMLKTIINNALKDNNVTVLESFLKISYLASDDEDDKQIFSIAEHAIEVIKDDELSQEQKSTAIKQIINYLNQ